jgi:hypothetical protein
MVKHDIHDNELHPGDYICWVSKNTLYAGQIQSISLKGTIRVKPWNDEIKQYSAITQQIKSYKIIKTKGLHGQN